MSLLASFLLTKMFPSTFYCRYPDVPTNEDENGFDFDGNVDADVSIYLLVVL